MKNYLIFYILLVIYLGSCKSESEGPDINPPKVLQTQPADNASNVDVSTELFIEFDEDILLALSYHITINGSSVTASKLGRKIKIDTYLAANTTYTVNVSGSSVKDLTGNFIPEFSYSFTTESGDASVYEAEVAKLSSGLSVQKSISGYSGSGYVGSFSNANDSLVFTLNNMSKGNYDLYIAYSTSSWGAKVCNVNTEGSVGQMQLPASTAFSKAKYATIKLKQGTNKIKISPNYTYFTIDYIQIIPNTDPEVPFNIATNLVTPSPSSQAVNLYNFLKESFGTKVLSGTMAAYSTNINEATWVHDQTGKWPAMTFFDFIDHTNLGTNWVLYEAPYTLGSEWWQNNGIIGFSWHWRDPLTKSGSFYASETNFNVSKVTDTNSAEYKAMIADIDTIAGFLREFKQAGIPVIWRPLHEAAGTWFWWGAKGAAPCKALWQLLFDRLVNYHKLNNLIWVWTSNTESDALTWYPGDDYVDIIGMDIYPGKYQHGSQYAQFDKVKKIFGGKKLLTLSECDAAPDPALMKEYGDMWSWFMPWNGSNTRSDEYNGAAWWNKFYGYDFVITRDKMPNLK
jgi:mannan endo-1,4-beta-mannosidase